MTVAIMQPTYLPWLGYFELINRADQFVFLDDVQFARRSWQQRNRIVLNGKEKMLTVPVLTKGQRDQVIAEVDVDDTQKWRHKHLMTIRQAYNKTPFGKKIISMLGDVLECDETKLAAVNEQIIRTFADYLSINTKFHRASDLNCGGNKSEHLFAICKALNADTYLSAAGSRDYIEEEGFFSGSSIDVEYQDYQPREYPQQGPDEFVPYLSIIDAMCNIDSAEVKQHLETGAMQLDEVER